MFKTAIRLGGWIMAAAGLALSQPAFSDNHKAPAPIPFNELSKAFGWGFDIEIKAEKHGEGFYVLFGVGGNIGASIGEQGVLIVDNQFPEIIPKVKEKIKELGGGDIDFAINTHWHFDHADGNKTLGKEGTWIVAQSNSRQKMLGNHIINLVGMSYRQKAYEPSALPVIAYDDKMQFHFNGEQIDLMHFGPAHTTGDTAVIFRGNNAVHMGDVFNMTGYPFIDADNGGELAGLIKFCEAVLGEINEKTIMVPGHGEVVGYKEFKAYIDMLKTIKERIEGMVADGASLAEVMAAKPTQEFDEANGDPAMFLNRAYHSLKKGK
ncbi:MAG: MBL fold metallo-hydrolase [Pseudomonadota bacterium]